MAERADIATGETKKALQSFVADLDSGRVRLVAAGPSGLDPWTGSLIVQITDGDGSLEDAVERILGSLSYRRPESRQTRDVQLEIGKAVRITTDYPVPPGSPEGSVASQSIDYIVRLADGRTMWLNATGPQAADGFVALIDPAVDSLRRR